MAASLTGYMLYTSRSKELHVKIANLSSKLRTVVIAQPELETKGKWRKNEKMDMAAILFFKRSQKYLKGISYGWTVHSTNCRCQTVKHISTWKSMVTKKLNAHCKNKAKTTKKSEQINTVSYHGISMWNPCNFDMYLLLYL